MTFGRWKLRIAVVVSVVFGVGCEQAQLMAVDSSPASTTLSPNAEEFDMLNLNADDWAWTSRPLVVFADSPDEPKLAEQRRAVRMQCEGLAERDMVVIEIVGDAVKVDGEPRAADVAALKKHYDIPPDATFALRLIGKDTGIKLRRAEPVTMDEIFGLIDSMPMRRREISEGPG